jgi:serine/threonine-protein kinase RsbT
MGNHTVTLPTSPLINGQVKGKPKIQLSAGLVERIPLNQPLDVAIARTTVRQLADDVGYSLIDQLRISSAIFEIADHIVTCAGQGEIVIFWHEDNQHKGLKFFCNDQGLRAPKLADIFNNRNTARNETDMVSVTSSRKLVDTVEFTEDPKLGNCLNILIWLD